MLKHLGKTRKIASKTRVNPVCLITQTPISPILKLFSINEFI